MNLVFGIIITFGTILMIHSFETKEKIFTKSSHSDTKVRSGFTFYEPDVSRIEDCLVHCMATSCVSVSYQPGNKRCQLSMYHPDDPGNILNQKPPWTMYC